MWSQQILDLNIMELNGTEKTEDPEKKSYQTLKQKQPVCRVSSSNQIYITDPYKSLPIFIGGQNL